MSTTGPDQYTVVDEPSGPRTGTIVWGVVLAMLGLGAFAIGLGLRLDLQLSLIVLLGVAGVGLLVKALLPRNGTPSP